MCGIVGIVGTNAEAHSRTIERMKAAISHRGPDGDGSLGFDQCLLGHVRLSVIDISGGLQPMSDTDGLSSITFNGEIYNYLELSDNISYKFRTHSDTEVLLALYNQCESDFLVKLKGMFSFAIWDERQRKLFCARDRFGEKPFFYAFGKNGEFVFSSEIKALVASGLIDLTLDRESLSHYLQRLYVPVDKTIYKNIHILPAACQLTYKDSKLEIQKYWVLPQEQEIDLSDAVGEFSRLFDEAVKRQLIADVEVGAFLSGGLDSSTIVAKASQHNQKLKTFSFGFTGAGSELPYAKSVANRYKTEHFELDDSDIDLSSLLIQMQTVYDEPFADSSNIPTYLISRFAQQHVKVVLSGDGADELLGGYDFWYRPLCHMISSKDKSFAKYYMAIFISSLSRRMLGRSLDGLNHYIEGARLRKNHSSVIEAKLDQNLYFSDLELSKFGLTCGTGLVDIVESGTINDALRADILDYMPGDILTKVDRASMANSLEVRAPFLDPDFASFCISLPGSLKVTSSADKIIMRRAFGDMWPDAIKCRRKQGFGAPVHEWLKRDGMKMLKVEYLEDTTKKIFTVLDRHAVLKYIHEDTYKTWILLVLSIWLESHESQ